MAEQRTLGASDIARWMGALVFVLGLFFTCIWVLKKTGRFHDAITEESEMRVLGSLPIGAKERVVLIQLGVKQLLLSVGNGSTQTLCVLEGEDCLNMKQASLTGVGGSFAEKLTQVMKSNVSR